MQKKIVLIIAIAVAISSFSVFYFVSKAPRGKITGGAILSPQQVGAGSVGEVYQKDQETGQSSLTST